MNLVNGTVTAHNPREAYFPDDINVRRFITLKY